MGNDSKTPIEYNDGIELLQGEYYIKDNICFTYDVIGNNEKPFLLDNTIRLNHIPCKEDIGTSNLIPSTLSMTEEERKKHMSDMGKISAEKRKARRTFKESAELFLSLKASKRQIESLSDDIRKYIPSDIELTQEDLIIIKALEMAQDGSEKHSVFVRDTVGEKPSNDVTISAEVITDNDKQLIEKMARRLELSEKL